MLVSNWNFHWINIKTKIIVNFGLYGWLDYDKKNLFKLNLSETHDRSIKGFNERISAAEYYRGADQLG